MAFIPPNNPKTGISITGLLLGVVVDQSYDQKYTNYRMGISTESRPDKFGQVVQTTNEIELTESQYQKFSHSINSNIKQPVNVWLDITHRAGEKNGRVWEILALNMRLDSQIEFLNDSASNPTPVLAAAGESKIPSAIKKD
jgi:hypothetical protein